MYPVLGIPSRRGTCAEAEKVGLRVSGQVAGTASISWNRAVQGTRSTYRSWLMRISECRTVAAVWSASSADSRPLSSAKNTAPHRIAHGSAADAG